jgi:hypothetical protein
MASAFLQPQAATLYGAYSSGPEGNHAGRVGLKIEF